MNFGEIKYCDIGNGPGVRTTLFVSGCTHHCKECFNPQTWDFSYGKPFTTETENEMIASLQTDYVQGITLLGGEPWEVENQKVLLPFLKRIRTEAPQKDIWAFSGYRFEELVAEDTRCHSKDTLPMLKLVDVLVDGEFILEKKNISLTFRGSENQRILDVTKSLEQKQAVWMSGYEPGK